MSKLSAKRQRFAEEYLVDLNGTQAAIRAGYATIGAKVTASRLLTDANVQQAVQTGRARLSERTDVTVERVIEEYRRIAFADLRNLVAVVGGDVVITDTDDLTDEQAASLAEVSATKDGVRIKTHSKIAALDSLAKHLGLFAADNKSVVEFAEPPVIPDSCR